MRKMPWFFNWSYPSNIQYRLFKTIHISVSNFHRIKTNQLIWMKSNWVRYILLQNISYMHKKYYVQSCINEKQYSVVKMAGKSVFQLFSLYALDTTTIPQKIAYCGLLNVCIVCDKTLSRYLETLLFMTCMATLFSIN